MHNPTPPRKCLLTKWSNFASLERKLRSGIYSHVVLQFFVIEVGLESKAVGRPENLGASILIQGLLKYLTRFPSNLVKIWGRGELTPLHPLFRRPCRKEIGERERRESITNLLLLVLKTTRAQTHNTNFHKNCLLTFTVFFSKINSITSKGNHL